MATADAFLDAPVKSSADAFLDTSDQADTFDNQSSFITAPGGPVPASSEERAARDLAESNIRGMVPRQDVLESRAGLWDRFRASPIAQKIFGPPFQREVFPEAQPTTADIAEQAAMQAGMALAPEAAAPKIIRAGTRILFPAIGAKALLAQPAMVDQISKALSEGDTRTAQDLIANEALNAAMLGVGAAEGVFTRRGAPPRETIEAAGTIKPPESEAPNAIEERLVQESNLGEYPRVEAQRQAAEPSGGNRPLGSPPSEVPPPQQPQVLTEGASEATKTGLEDATKAPKVALGEASKPTQALQTEAIPINPRDIRVGDRIFTTDYGYVDVERVHPFNPQYPRSQIIETSRGRRDLDPTTGPITIERPIPQSRPAATTADILGAVAKPPPVVEEAAPVETFESMAANAKTPEEIERARNIIESSKNLTRSMKDEYLSQVAKPSTAETGMAPVVEPAPAAPVVSKAQAGAEAPAPAEPAMPQVGTEPAKAQVKPFEPGASEHSKEQALGGAIRDKILSAPSFPALLKAAKAFQKSLHGSVSEQFDVDAQESPWDLLSAHSGVLHAKSARAKTLKSLADAVISETGLPMKKAGMYRGMDYRIDWDKLQSQTYEQPTKQSGVSSVRPGSVLATAPRTSPATTAEVLSGRDRIKITAPEGSTQIRITDKSGKVAVAPITALNKANTFQGVDIAKVEAGIIGKDKKFVPVKGDVTVTPQISMGPGGETAGEPKYSAIQQLVDQLKQVPESGLPEKITARERIADTWAKGKSAMDAVIARTQSISQSIKDTARGVRDVTDLDRRVGVIDFALQRSSAMSKRAKGSIRSQIKDQVTRDAVAIWNDTPGTDAEKIAAIQDTLANLPDKMPNRIRRALQKATNLDDKARDFSESLRQYYGIRLNDAQEAAIFENGLEDYYTHIWKKEANMPDDLRSALSNGRVSTYFEFARKRKFGTFLDGIRAGKVPELDPADVVPIYNYSLDRAIASRQFIRDVSEMVDADGRPTLSPAGRSVPVEKGGTPDRLIIKPKARSEENADYQIINHPALRKWKWAGTDENGNPILYQSDLLVHPNSYQRLSRMMDRSRLTPSPLVRGLLTASTEVKGMKLGLLSAFHAIHTGSHALFHWTNPFRAARNPIDWESPATQFAVEKGHLKLAPDPAELKIASEGIVPGRLVEKIPILGPWSRAWSEFQFGELIPRWKLQTFENAYKRNIWARDNVPLSGLKGLSDEQVAARVGDSVNNAFGELNPLFLGKYGRSPEFRRILRGIFLAPDFGEARLRFVEKAFTKAGFEERLALATMFLTLYTGARVANYLSHGDPEMDWKKAFAVKFGDHWWSMRSVVGDLDHLFADFGRFMYVRLNPLYARTASDMLFGRDVSGRKLTAWQKFVSRPLDQLIPIQFGALTRDDQKIWESFVTAMGVQTQRDSPTRDLRQIIGGWKKASTNPKIRADWERSQQELFAPSPYEPLRNALRLDNPERAVAEYQKLRAIRKPAEIDQAMQNKRPFTGSQEAEKQFKAQMTPQQKVIYDAAVKEREELYRKYKAIIHNEVQQNYAPIPQPSQPNPMGQ